jgi:hypothetical protein
VKALFLPDTVARWSIAAALPVVVYFSSIYYPWSRQWRAAQLAGLASFPLSTTYQVGIRLVGLWLVWILVWGVYWFSLELYAIPSVVLGVIAIFLSGRRNHVKNRGTLVSRLIWLVGIVSLIYASVIVVPALGVPPFGQWRDLLSPVLGFYVGAVASNISKDCQRFFDNMARQSEGGLPW